VLASRSNLSGSYDTGEDISLRNGTVGWVIMIVLWNNMHTRRTVVAPLMDPP
jgi:hypothetical protein